MTILDRSEDGLVLESMSDGSYQWLRPEDYPGLPVVPDGGARDSAASAPSIEAPAPAAIPDATPADILATPDRFMHWLNQQPGDVYVGESGEATICPLANFLTDAGFVYPSVRHWEIHWLHGVVATPAWARRFIGLVDFTNAHRPTPIGASHARALVVQAVRETSGG